MKDRASREMMLAQEMAICSLTTRLERTAIMVPHFLQKALIQGRSFNLELDRAVLIQQEIVFTFS